MKQNKKQKQTLESAQYGLEINFKVHINFMASIVSEFNFVQQTSLAIKVRKPASSY